MGGRILDTTAGAALRSGSLVLAVPAAALAAARGERDQLVRLSPVVVDGLSADVAARAGELLAQARQRPSGAVMRWTWFHVAFSARVRAWPVVTSDPGPLRALDAALDIDALP